jgi:hypothetical protein
MLNMYEGEVDDVMVWSKPPPPKKDILQLWKNESSSPPTPGHQVVMVSSFLRRLLRLQ